MRLYVLLSPLLSRCIPFPSGAPFLPSYQIFSALNSMLPSSMGYLTRGGFDDQQAGLIMMSCFVGGFLGIQVVTRFLHRLMPSHVVDCDHTHDEPVDEHRASSLKHRHSKINHGRHDLNGSVLTESTPLLPTEAERNGHLRPTLLATASDLSPHIHGPIKDARRLSAPQSRGPSILQVQKRVLSFMRDTKPNCDEFGPCFGYSDPCGQECFKHFGTRFAFNPRSQVVPRTTSATPQTGLTTVVDEDAEHGVAPTSATSSTHRLTPKRSLNGAHIGHDECHSPSHTHTGQEGDHDYVSENGSDASEDVEAQHHHHVPTNAFLSIGLQTVIAIALHKFPEGFITYATNHASPALGFNVFMALFVHNIADGFAMSLPLYMALGSRVKAIFWSSLLGGLSQPMGAAIAVLWFKIANRSNLDIDNVAYACMFAVTAGIMSSVALQLFVESLSLNHNRNLNTFFAFLGMLILGLSNTLVAE